MSWMWSPQLQGAAEQESAPVASVVDARFSGVSALEVLTNTAVAVLFGASASCGSVVAAAEVVTPAGAVVVSAPVSSVTTVSAGANSIVPVSIRVYANGSVIATVQVVSPVQARVSGISSAQVIPSTVHSALAQVHGTGSARGSNQTVCPVSGRIDSTAEVRANYTTGVQELVVCTVFGASLDDTLSATVVVPLAGRTEGLTEVRAVETVQGLTADDESGTVHGISSAVAQNQTILPVFGRPQAVTSVVAQNQITAPVLGRIQTISSVRSSNETVSPVFGRVQGITSVRAQNQTVVTVFKRVQTVSFVIAQNQTIVPVLGTVHTVSQVSGNGTVQTAGLAEDASGVVHGLNAQDSLYSVVASQMHGEKSLSTVAADVDKVSPFEMNQVSLGSVVADATVQEDSTVSVEAKIHGHSTVVANTASVVPASGQISALASTRGVSASVVVVSGRLNGISSVRTETDSASVVAAGQVNGLSRVTAAVVTVVSAQATVHQISSQQVLASGPVPASGRDNGLSSVLADGQLVTFDVVSVSAVIHGHSQDRCAAVTVSQATGRVHGLSRDVVSASSTVPVVSKGSGLSQITCDVQIQQPGLQYRVDGSGSVRGSVVVVSAVQSRVSGLGTVVTVTTLEYQFHLVNASIYGLSVASFNGGLITPATPGLSPLDSFFEEYETTSEFEEYDTTSVFTEYENTSDWE